MVTEEDNPVVVAMPNDPPNGLVHSPGRLLSVPVLPREELGKRAGHEGSPGSPRPAHQVAPHLACSPTPALHLI